MKKLEFTKEAVSFVVGAGTTRIVTQVIKNNTDPATGPYTKATNFAGALVIGKMAADATKEYTNAKIDAAAAWWDEHVKSN